MRSSLFLSIALLACTAVDLEGGPVGVLEDSGTTAETSDTATSIDAPTADADAVADVDAADVLDTRPTCTPKPIAEACKIPESFAAKGYPSCGPVSDGCGGTIACGTCAGICTRSPWDDPPGREEAGMCVCADGYNPDKKCNLASGTPGRWFTCFKDAEWSYGEAPGCVDATLSGAAYKSWCCP